MKLDSVKDLETLIKMLRKQNVDIVKLGDIEIVLGKMPEKTVKRPTIRNLAADSISDIDETIQVPLPNLDIPTDEPTEEQIMFGSSDPSVWSNEQ